MRLRMEGRARRTSNRRRGRACGEDHRLDRRGGIAVGERLLRHVPAHPRSLQSRARAAQLAFATRSECVAPFPAVHSAQPAFISSRRPLLCQLQSGFRRGCQVLLQQYVTSSLSRGSRDASWDSSPTGALTAPMCPLANAISDRVSRSAISGAPRSFFHPRLHVRELPLGSQLLGEVLAVSSDVFLAKRPSHTSAT